ncbi:UDP-glucose 4-epimerase GalE [Salisediminibacterium halotolerans]|uniref:UDP-glucose 4-epimerase GalE n=1 Tax=Salisediminibacterium halotolerans TaxID=517425 RepID=UPI000EB0C559|nr:UDP-glucose 4-epimerase GalE [Salisediminibacterium halotolerans]RLJ75766.1 UDP-galactose 4-epimerase [Actinophytocola xinjiangensis]RPE89620.1 UDP-galactose 4-epimerase [Salisediminibacterium halotolerans]TWG36379.1 UDP-galactose 4-epimerase [Salisediminibacterium halotolerans]GEL07544.1 UDP-glucose 4-epimerase GalE [Salisediminibacterium halotolerans]
MAVLVCGGAGYIGSHATVQLLEQGKDVVVFDNLETGNQASIHADAVFYHGDLRNKDDVSKVFAEQPIDAVMHFAANSLVGESVEKPLKYYQNNVGGAAVLLEVMAEYGVDKIVFSSTAATYGNPVNVPIRETDPTVPTNPYGETKLAVEKMLKWSEDAYGIRNVCLRYFNVAGAHPTEDIGEDHKPETHLIPIILQVPLKQREHVYIFGDDYPTADGTCIRDYIHVNDLIDAHLLALDYLHNGHDSDVFNLGNGDGFSVKEVIDTARRVTGDPIPAKTAERRAGDPAELVASSDKAQSVLGWKPKHADLTTIIETAWQWHQRHPGGYETASQSRTEDS